MGKYNYEQCNLVEYWFTPYDEIYWQYELKNT